MTSRFLKLSLVIAATSLVFASDGLAMPGDDDLSVLSRLGHVGPTPLRPELSGNGMVLYHATRPVVYVANPDPVHEPARIRPPINLLTTPESATSSFSITVVPAGGTDLWGEPCYTFPAEAEASFNAATSLWANIVQSSVPITIRACWANLGSSNILGYSGGGNFYIDFPGAPRPLTWYSESLANALAGFDLDPNSFDMHITYNSNFIWYYGTDGLTPAGQYDLMSVVLHEITHGLNFSGLMSYSAGSGSWGYGTGYPSIYDTYMRDGSGNELINTALYPNPSTALGSALTSNDIWFHGSHAMAANSGARVKMYAPSTWSGGSSYSHLDYSTFNETSNELMVYAFSSGESVHDPGPVTRGLLEDLGWQITPPGLPDLIETDVSNPPATATAGNSFSVTDSVKNQGSASAGPSTTAYYLSFDTMKGSGDILLTGSRPVPSLEVNAGESGSLVVTIPSNTAAGAYYLLACADNTNAVVESNEGNNCIASASQVNVSAVTSVDPNYAWHTFYGGSGYESGRNITTDGDGNIYITGDSSVAWTGPAGQAPLHAHSGGYDIFVLKLDRSGSYQWHAFYGAGGWDLGYGIVTDESGNVYVTGESDAAWTGPAGQNPLHAYRGNMDIVILKLDHNGAYQWHTFYGSRNRDDPRSIVTDGSGNVYVAGFGESTWNGPGGQRPLRAHSTGSDIFVLKLNHSGAYQWHTFSGATSSSNVAYEIAADGNGNFYVTGYSIGSWNGPAGQSPLQAYTGGVCDMFVLKLNGSGAYQWHTFYGSNGEDQALGIATDGSGNVYVTGISDMTWNGPGGVIPLDAHTGAFDIFVLKLDSGGVYQWHTFYGSSIYDYGYGIVTDGRGNVYIAGDSSAAWNGPAGQSPLHFYTGGNDIFVLKLDASGAYRWHTFYGANYGDYGTNITADEDGNVYITGTSYATWNGPAGETPLHAYGGTPGVSDLYVLKLSDTPSRRDPNNCDFDGDGTTDITVWRPAYGYWFIINSKDESITFKQWGELGDIPVAGDYDGDGKTDIAVWRPGSGVWYIIGSKDGNPIVRQWGEGSQNDVPVPGDYDGDGKTDIAVWRPAYGYWFIINSRDQSITFKQWGENGDIPVVGDYDGDGKTDIAVWHPAYGYWSIIHSKDQSITFKQWGEGSQNDIPVPGDYDGDGKTDIAVWRPGSGVWYIISSRDGTPIVKQWGEGSQNDEPISEKVDW